MTRSQVQVLNRPPEIIERPARDVFIFVIIWHVVTYNGRIEGGRSCVFTPLILFNAPSGAFLFVELIPLVL